MTKLWCKLWNFFLRIFNQVVETAATMLKTIGRAVVDVLADALDAVGDAIDSVFDGSTAGKLILIAGGLGLLYFLFSGSDDTKNKVVNTSQPVSSDRRLLSTSGGLT